MTYTAVSLMASTLVEGIAPTTRTWREGTVLAATIAPLVAWRAGLPLLPLLVAGVVTQALCYGIGAGSDRATRCADEGPRTRSIGSVDVGRHTEPAALEPAGEPFVARRILFGVAVLLALSVWLFYPAYGPVATYMGISLAFSTVSEGGERARPDWRDWIIYVAILGPVAAWRAGAPLIPVLLVGAAIQLGFHGRRFRQSSSGGAPTSDRE